MIVFNIALIASTIHYQQHILTAATKEKSTRQDLTKNNNSASAETQPSQTEVSTTVTPPPILINPYGEIFNKEKEKLPFYLQPEFGGLDGSDHRRDARPNAAGQRLDMDQYGRQVRPLVGQ